MSVDNSNGTHDI